MQILDNSKFVWDITVSNSIYTPPSHTNKITSYIAKATDFPAIANIDRLVVNTIYDKLKKDIL